MSRQNLRSRRPWVKWCAGENVACISFLLLVGTGTRFDPTQWLIPGPITWLSDQGTAVCAEAVKQGFLEELCVLDLKVVLKHRGCLDRVNMLKPLKEILLRLFLSGM